MQETAAYVESSDERQTQTHLYYVQLLFQIFNQYILRYFFIYIITNTIFVFWFSTSHKQSSAYLTQNNELSL